MRKLDRPRSRRSRGSDRAARLEPKIVNLAGSYRPPETTGLLRPKRALSPLELWILGLLAALPFVTMALRILALPGIAGPEFFGLAQIGNTLNQYFSLSDVPADQRNHVLYLLFVPTCAMMVAFFNITFGIRVLGFRSILISVAFHQSGVVASLLLIAVAVVAVLLLRPWLRQIKLPYYARVSVILCAVAVTMVGVLLLGPWLRSDIAWGMATFPVIVLGMLAEGIARTVDRENVGKASWLAVNTVLLAFLMALVCQVPVFRSFILRFPEFVLTQIVAIVMVSEFLDLRLFQRWQRKLAGVISSRSPATSRVAVVRNRIEDGALVRPSHGRALRSVQKIVDALRKGGYTVRVLEGDPKLLKQLRRFFPPDPTTGERYGIVFNLAHGMHGDAGSTHVPAILEMSGVPYSGPNPLGHAVLSDRVAAKVLFQQAGIPTPAFRVVTSAKDPVKDLLFPAVVRLRHEAGVKPTIVTDRAQLKKAIKKLVRRHARDVVVEEVEAGRRISVALLGNDPVECLPLVETDPKRHKKICPAPLDDAIAAQIREYAVAAFRTCGCRDYARVDLCVGPSMNLWVLEVKSLGILARGGAFVRAGLEAGFTFKSLVCRIVEVTRARSLTTRADEREEDVKFSGNGTPVPVPRGVTP